MGAESQDERRARCLRLLAHDLNNPLTAIRILAEMLRDELPDGSMRQDMGDVLEAADLASALIEGMSSMLRLETREERYTWFPLDLVEVVRAAVSRPALERYVVLDLPDTLPMGGDRRALQRAVTDLLVNARRLAESREIEVSARDKGHVELVIRHPGPGVPAALRRHLFTLFGAVDLRREHRIPVSAAGLTYAAHVIQHHRGTVRFEDRDDGMDLVVVLPR